MYSDLNSNPQSAQWESNPHVRHGKAIGYRYIMGAALYQAITNQSIRRELHPRSHLGGVACCYLHHGYIDSGSGGNRTHVYLLKRQAPGQRRSTLPFSGPHGSRTRTLPRDKRPLYRLSFWTVSHFTSRWRRNRTPQDEPSVLETECAPRRIHHLCFTNFVSTPCGSRTRPRRLERPPTSPEVERGIFAPVRP